MDRAEKTEVVANLKKTFQENGGVILLGFDRVKVPDITELRQKVRASEGNYRVVKNTLALLAAEGTPVEGLKEHFTGPTAVAFTDSDPVALAKTLKAFVRNEEGVAFKAGVLEGALITSEQVKELADLPSREELLSKLLFLLNAPLTQLAGALKSPLRNLAYVLSQLAEKRS